MTGNPVVSGKIHEGILERIIRSHLKNQTTRIQARRAGLFVALAKDAIANRVTAIFEMSSNKLELGNC